MLCSSKLSLADGSPRPTVCLRVAACPCLKEGGTFQPMLPRGREPWSAARAACKGPRACVHPLAIDIDVGRDGKPQQRPKS